MRAFLVAVTAVTAATGLILAASAAQAQTFPEPGKGITLIVPYPPGGPTDVGTRLLAGVMEKELGVSVQIINKPGGNQQIGVTELTQSKPDGYTFAMVGVSGVAMSYIDKERGATYDRDDIQPVALYMSDTNLLVVPADSPFKSLDDVVAAGKARPGKVRLGTSGLMSASHFSGLAMENVTGARYAIVQFSGAAPLATAILAGNVDAAVTGVLATVPHERTGAMRVLATFDGKTSDYFPGVKPATDQGLDVSIPVNFGLIAPAGTPSAAVAAISEVMGKAINGGDLAKKLHDVGLTANYQPTQEFESFWAQAEKQTVESLKLARDRIE